jgi:hypothetical protein
MIGVFRRRDSRPIKWHQGRLLTLHLAYYCHGPTARILGAILARILTSADHFTQLYIFFGVFFLPPSMNWRLTSTMFNRGSLKWWQIPILLGLRNFSCAFSRQLNHLKKISLMWFCLCLGSGGPTRSFLSLCELRRRRGRGGGLGTQVCQPSPGVQDPTKKHVVYWMFKKNKAIGVSPTVDWQKFLSYT